MTIWRRLALVAVAAMTVSSCAYLQAATNAETSGGPVPWWCTATEEIPVTDGPAVGTVDWYVGTHKAPLPWDQCKAMSAQFDLARGYATQWPTRGEAEADGWREVTGYIPGMGTHHVRGGITPAMLADPSFDPAEPHPRRRGARRRLRPRQARRAAVRRRRSQRQARRLRLLRPHRHRAAPCRVPRQQRLVAPPPDDLPPHDRRRDGRVQHQQRAAARRWAASTSTCPTTTCSTSGSSRT